MSLGAVPLIAPTATTPGRGHREDGRRSVQTPPQHCQQFGIGRGCERGRREHAGTVS